MESKFSRLCRNLPGYLKLLTEGRLYSTLKKGRKYRLEQRRLMMDLEKRNPETTVIEEIVDRSRGGVQGVSAEIGQFWYVSNALAKIKPDEYVLWQSI